jgi:hypothetical protein
VQYLLKQYPKSRIALREGWSQLSSFGWISSVFRFRKSRTGWERMESYLYSVCSQWPRTKPCGRHLAVCQKICERVLPHM